MKKRILTEQRFQIIITGKRLTPDEEAVLRKKFGFPYNKKVYCMSANKRKRLLMKAHMKVIKK